MPASSSCQQAGHNPADWYRNGLQKKYSNVANISLLPMDSLHGMANDNVVAQSDSQSPF